jgi:small-conductance mechanosensitive channel
MGSGGGAAWVASVASRFAGVLVALLLMAAPPARASDDVSARVAQARGLIATPQGTALLNLLDDPAVRQQLLATPADPTSSIVPIGSMGRQLDHLLGDVRQRIVDLGTQLRLLPAALGACWDRLRAAMPAAELSNLLLYLIAFIAGGVACQRLFRFASRPWLAHFDHLGIDTLEQRLGVLIERLAFALLLLGAFAAGSMGTFLLFNWPASSGWIILGYLWASLVVRFSLTVSRFLLAPAAERLRLVPITTRVAWFWHRWLVALTAIGAYGLQTIMMLRGLGLPHDSVDLLRTFVLLALGVCGITMIWMQPDGAVRHRHSPRRTSFRILMSFALLVTWLLFLTGAAAAADSLLVIAVVPIALYVLRNASSRVICGHCLQNAEEITAIGAIADRCVQAVVVVTAAFVLVQIWQINPAMVTANDTAMTRIGRGLFEALVILLLSDLLWLVIRALIDVRLSGAVVPIDDLDDDALRRRARVRTLLPVLRNFIFIFVLIIASLSALAAMGLQIGPLLAGAGVVGIAVGFGAQTMVRDILSGVFFLLDDAFRVGELIESGGISGTVEAFSIRSVKLRHYKGPLHTVPFGDLKAITNYSRDWVNELVEVTVTYDTDLARVEEAIERVSADVMQDAALASVIIAPPHSIGVTGMVAPGIHIGVIIRTRPGQQFKVRAVVYSRLKAAFDAEGIRFAV